MLLGLQLNELGQTMLAGAPLLEWLKAIGVWAALSVVFIVGQRVLAGRIEARGGSNPVLSVATFYWRWSRSFSD